MANPNPITVFFTDTARLLIGKKVDFLLQPLVATPYSLARNPLFFLPRPECLSLIVKKNLRGDKRPAWRYSFFYGIRFFLLLFVRVVVGPLRPTVLFVLFEKRPGCSASRLVRPNVHVLRGLPSPRH
jgi:hypothetical protein